MDSKSSMDGEALGSRRNTKGIEEDDFEITGESDIGSSRIN